MPKLRLLLCCLALLFLAAPAMAEEDELAPGFDRCMEQSGGVTTEMLGCLQQAYEYWDARLNTNYKKARQACKSSSDPKACSDKLLKGQRAWVQYKEAFTDLVQLPNEGGSMARLNSMSFLTGETRKQALLLGQKIVVMHPDSTICEFDLTDLPYPRDPDSPRLRQLKEQITAQCRMATAN